MDSNDKDLTTIILEIQKLKNTNERLKKEINKLSSSRLWKITKPFRRQFNSSDEINALKLAFQEQENELCKLNRRVLTIELELNKFYGELKSLKASADTFYINQELIKRKKNINNRLNMAIYEIMRQHQDSPLEIQEELYNQMIKGLSINEIPEFIIRKGNSQNGIHLDNMASFKVLLNIQASKSKLNELPIEKMLDDKLKAYKLADLLSIKRPWISEIYNHYKNLPPKESVVLKPVNGAGSRGVYLIKDQNTIIDLRHSRELSNWNQLEIALKRDLDEQLVKEDKWYFEELIENEEKPARDYKFYTFYGEVGLILEISRIPEIKYCWWTRDSERISVEKYDENLYKGTPVNAEQIKLVEKISKELPLPFVRIDFLSEEKGYVFNEFTPYPGNYDEFDEETDRFLGKLYLKAQNRLENDLIAGKKFDVFNTWTSKYFG